MQITKLAFLSDYTTDWLKDVSLVAGSIVVVGSAVGLLTRLVMKQFLKWLKENMRVLIQEELNPITQDLHDAKNTRNDMISILKEMQPAIGELMKNSGSTIKDKIDELYETMLHDGKGKK